MQSTWYAVRVTTITPLLGSAPLSEEIYSQFIAQKAAVAVAASGNGHAPDPAAELKRLEPSPDRGRTGFLRDDYGHPLLMDYQIRGYLKEAWRACKAMKGSASSGLRAGLAAIDRYVFVEPRFVWLRLPQGGKESVLERPLRASTPQGYRVALASSEMLPTGTWFDVKVRVLAEVDEALIREWFAYGEFVGIGQWRGSGGYGRFTANVKPYTPSNG